MNKQFINFVKKIFRKFGVEFSKVQKKGNFNLDLYKKIYSFEELKKKPFYNIGAANFYHPYWTNVDFLSDWYKDSKNDNTLHHDLTSNNPLPIKDNTAKVMYTSHTIEHIKDYSVEFFFQDAYRCLDSGGIFRVISGPDAETDYRALMEKDYSWFYWDESYVKKGTYEHNYTAPATSVSLAERWIHNVATALSKIDVTPNKNKLDEKEILSILKKRGLPSALDYFCSLVEFDPKRPGNHISWWTHEKIINLLKKSGFKNVYRSGYGQSASPIMRRSSLFDSTHPQMSIYVEAVK